MESNLPNIPADSREGYTDGISETRNSGSRLVWSLPQQMWSHLHQQASKWLLAQAQERQERAVDMELGFHENEGAFVCEGWQWYGTGDGRW